jgi:hypothetical protein
LDIRRVFPSGVVWYYYGIEIATSQAIVVAESPAKRFFHFSVGLKSRDAIIKILTMDKFLKKKPIYFYSSSNSQQ